MRARYYKGEHMGKSWGGPWEEATITVAGEPAETPTPEPSPDPTPAAGTIDALATTDDDAGQLVLTWSAPAAPNATPTDYHVSWAKSTEDYPADTTTDGNAHSTTATYTLAGLDYDTDYNVRVRARYTDGENTDSPWNGPWTETTAQVKLPLPMTPNMTGAAVSPASQVYLFWSEPSNDSITGYQILRGPAAANLAIIEDDTGSSFDQLHRHGTSCGPDPHLRREGPQRLGAEPPVEHAHRDRASGRRGRSPHHRTAWIYRQHPGFKLRANHHIYTCSCRNTRELCPRTCYVVHDRQ